MRDKITLKEFFESEETLCIHCDTEEKANKLLKEFDKLGKKWCTREGYLENTYFYIYKDKTCYSNDGTYGEIEFLKDEYYKIYSFEDIIFEEEHKSKNLIPEIAKMLGVEIGEEFVVIEQGYTKYKLDLANGLMYFDEDRNIWIRTSSTLNELLCSSNTIVEFEASKDIHTLVLCTNENNEFSIELSSDTGEFYQSFEFSKDGYKKACRLIKKLFKEEE